MYHAPYNHNTIGLFIVVTSSALQKCFALWAYIKWQWRLTIGKQIMHFVFLFGNKYFYYLLFCLHLFTLNNTRTRHFSESEFYQVLGYSAKSEYQTEFRNTPNIHTNILAGIHQKYLHTLYGIFYWYMVHFDDDAVGLIQFAGVMRVLWCSAGTLFIWSRRRRRSDFHPPVAGGRGQGSDDTKHRKSSRERTATWGTDGEDDGSGSQCMTICLV